MIINGEKYIEAKANYVGVGKYSDTKTPGYLYNATLGDEVLQALEVNVEEGWAIVLCADENGNSFVDPMDPERVATTKVFGSVKLWIREDMAHYENVE